MTDVTTTTRAAGALAGRRRGRLAVLLMAGVLALVAACGDASDPAEAEDATIQDETNPAIEGSGDETGPDAADGDEASTDEASTDEASTDDQAATFCAEVAPLNEEADQVIVGDATDPTELRGLVDRLSQLDPPDEIAADFELTLEAFRLYADALDGDSGARAELDERLDEFEAASERVEPFMRDVCGLDFGD